MLARVRTIALAGLLGLFASPGEANEWERLDRGQEDLQDYGHPIRPVRTNDDVDEVRKAVDRMIGRQWPTVRLALRTIGENIPKYVPGPEEQRIDELATTMDAYRTAFLRWRKDAVEPEVVRFDEALTDLKEKLDRTPEGPDDEAPADLSGLNGRITAVHDGLRTMRGLLAEMPRKLSTLLRAWAQLEGQRARDVARARERYVRAEQSMRSMQSKAVESWNRAQDLRTKAKAELKQPETDDSDVAGYFAAADRAQAAADRIMDQARDVLDTMREIRQELLAADQAQEQVARLLQLLSDRVFDL